MSRRWINTVNRMPQPMRNLLWWCRMALRIGK